LIEEIIEVSDSTFEEEVLNSKLPVLVDFWAEWCAPCRMIAPTLESIAQNFKQKMRVAKLNVESNVKIPSRYGIMSIPTLLLFKDGKVKETIIGVQPQEKIIDIISKHL